MEKKTKSVFCANEQAGTDHFVSIDSNGEWVFTCSVCDRVLKFPAKMTADEVNKALDGHLVANEGQITQEAIDKKIAEL